MVQAEVQSSLWQGGEDNLSTRESTLENINHREWLSDTTTT